jgi:serine/threonine protein phosphatase PrpC
MRLRAGVVSDCGLVRSANEDSFLLRPGLYAVCDGMGGARAGEVASQMACLGLIGVDPSSAGLEELRQAVITTNMAIIQRSTSESELLGMGTTLTAALFKDDMFVVAHIGDSRAYVLRDGGLTQMTADHSWVGEMVRRGELTAAAAAKHPHRSVITRALGTDLDLDPDVIELSMEPGDRVLLCSDGLTGMVDDETIGHIMSLGADAQTTAQSLVDAALQNGGEDNVTVVVVDVQGAADEGGASEAASWSDSRILVGPSNRESSVPVSSHGVERLSAAARERLRRRGPAVTRHGVRMSAENLAEARERRDDEGSSDLAGSQESRDQAAAAWAAASETAAPDGSGSGTVSAPTGKGRKKRRPAGAAARRPRRRLLIGIIIVLLVLVVATGGFAWYNSTVYYLADDNGKVALYRGLPWEFLGVEFSSVYRLATVDYQSLTPYDRTRVDSRELVSKKEGELFLAGLSIRP